MNNALMIAGIILLIIAIPLWFYNSALSLILGLLGLIILVKWFFRRKREEYLLNLEDVEATLLP